MNKKLTPAKVDGVKVDSKDIKVLENQDSLNFVGKEVGATIATQAVQAFIPIALHAVKKKIELDQETQKLVRDDKRNILNKQAEKLIMKIEKEDAKVDYNQERINRWSEEIEEIMRKLDVIEARSEGFTKGMLFNFKEIINSKLK